MPDGRDGREGRDGRDAIGQVLRVWPILGFVAMLALAAYVTPLKEQIATQTQKISSLEAASTENTAAHREIQAVARGNDQRLEGIQRQLTEQRQTMELVRLTVESLCTTTKGCRSQTR